MKPCPFCGGTIIQPRQKEGSTWNTCICCGTTGPVSEDDDDPYTWESRVENERLTKLEQMASLLSLNELDRIEDILDAVYDKAQAAGDTMKSFDVGHAMGVINQVKVLMK